MPRFPVSPKKAADLEARMRRLQIEEKQIVETHLNAGGIALLHTTSGIKVRAYRQRSQSLNRYYARRLLVEEVEARQMGKTRREVRAEALHEQKVRRGKGHGAGSKFNVQAAMNRYVVKPSNATAAPPAGVVRPE